MQVIIQITTTSYFPQNRAASQLCMGSLNPNGFLQFSWLVFKLSDEPFDGHWNVRDFWEKSVVNLWGVRPRKRKKSQYLEIETSVFLAYSLENYCFLPSPPERRTSSWQTSRKSKKNNQNPKINHNIYDIKKVQALISSTKSINLIGHW